MKTVFVVPKEGLKVRNPKDGAHLPDAGAEVPLDTYWRRRLRDGDVIEGKPPRAPAKQPAAKAKE